MDKHSDMLSHHAARHQQLNNFVRLTILTFWYDVNKI